MTRPATSRRMSEIIQGGLLTCTEVMEIYQEDERQIKQEEPEKAERVATRVTTQVAKGAAAAATAARGAGVAVGGGCV